jgi:hypothetical protein
LNHTNGNCCCWKQQVAKLSVFGLWLKASKPVPMPESPHICQM